MAPLKRLKAEKDDIMKYDYKMIENAIRNATEEIITYSNCEYKGQVKDGKENGYGIKTFKNGRIESGFYLEGALRNDQKDDVVSSQNSRQDESQVHLGNRWSPSFLPFCRIFYLQEVEDGVEVIDSTVRVNAYART